MIEAYLTDEDYIRNYWGDIDFECVKQQLAKRDYEPFIEVKDAVMDFVKISGFNKIAPQKIISKVLKPRMAHKINIQDKDLKVACFCESNKSIPMWAYYGKNHYGCCVEFDSSLLLDKSVQSKIFPVSYSESRDNDSVHFKKSEEWQHEGEWRIILRNYNKEYLPFDCVTGVYIGVKNDLTDEPNKTYKWLQNKQFCEKKYNYFSELIALVKESTHAISLYKADCCLDKYEIMFDKFL